MMGSQERRAGGAKTEVCYSSDEEGFTESLQPGLWFPWDAGKEVESVVWHFFGLNSLSR